MCDLVVLDNVSSLAVQKVTDSVSAQIWLPRRILTRNSGQP
jgi:hypothetical protein